MRMANWLGGVVLAVGLAGPVLAQPIVLEELDRTQGINLLLTLVRVEIAAQNCPNLTVAKQHSDIVHEKLVALATQLEIDDAELTGRFVGRGQRSYQADNKKFCDNWGPQVRPVAVALLE